MKNYILYILSVCIISGLSFLPTEKAFSQTSQKGENTSYVKGVTPGRAKALVGVAAGLGSLIIGLSARRRSIKQIGPGKGKNGAMIALTLGLTGVILGILHLSNSVGAVFGSGSGKAGAIFALILSLAGITFSWLVLRYRKVNTNLN
ncbi:DUF6223 family protein [Mucilaginibacter pocheonensis]|uniref:DUF4134 domain-containing protein n=1 Tax=Mucilaginibacter pocheonensis TaxID=398050 RepID=A0ABU1THT8_9SPHI|nr:DUF6223 family protein [Mucilaginibacter pocheonensis]MDR6944809.1 hypothetical protein [Mucilaginibacter pocheonensis]